MCEIDNRNTFNHVTCFYDQKNVPNAYTDINQAKEITMDQFVCDWFCYLTIQLSCTQNDYCNTVWENNENASILYIHIYHNLISVAW
jgi:hypothetical protein